MYAFHVLSIPLKFLSIPATYIICILILTSLNVTRFNPATLPTVIFWGFWALRTMNRRFLLKRSEVENHCDSYAALATRNSLKIRYFNYYFNVCGLAGLSIMWLYIYIYNTIKYLISIYLPYN